MDVQTQAAGGQSTRSLIPPEKNQLGDLVEKPSSEVERHNSISNNGSLVLSTNGSLLLSSTSANAKVTPSGKKVSNSKIKSNVIVHNSLFLICWTTFMVCFFANLYSVLVNA